MIQAQVDAAMEEGFEDALEEARNSDEFIEASQEAYAEAHDAVIEAVDEEWEEIAEEYSLNDEGFSPVPVSIFENFYHDESEDNNNDGTEDATVRIFRSDSTVDMATFIEGRAPQTDTEIAIDRMHADNVGVKVGDTITVGGREYEITGLLSYCSYLTLHESNTDLMFDAFGFNVAMITPEAFDALTSRLHYSYAFYYETKPADKIEAADFSESFLMTLR